MKATASKSTLGTFVATGQTATLMWRVAAFGADVFALELAGGSELALLPPSVLELAGKEGPSGLTWTWDGSGRVATLGGVPVAELTAFRAPIWETIDRLRMVHPVRVRGDFR